ncbi:MAG: HAD family hydrolase, partial [Flavobacteriaceae bacterium]
MYDAIVTDIFFDLDHTLWDFEKNSALTFEKILHEHHIEVDLARFLSYYIPINLEYWKLYREEKIEKKALRYQRLKTTFDKLHFSIEDETVDSLSTAYIAHLSSFNHLLPNTLEVLEYLKPKYKLHIITNGFQEIQEKKMRNSGILSYFDQIIDSEMAGVKKPNPHIFRMALNKANVNSNSAMMIGYNI